MAKHPPPRRTHNKNTREHEWITYEEFKRLRKAAAATGRHRHRDQLMILMGFRHGLRAVEVTRLDWENANLDRKTLDVYRAKRGERRTHDLSIEEINALKRLAGPGERSGPLFKTERGGRFTTSTFFKIVQRAGQVAGLDKPIHPHMLRHGCGFHMINRGRDIKVLKDWLGHRNIQNTDIYAQLSPERLRGAFPDEE